MGSISLAIPELLAKIVYIYTLRWQIIKSLKFTSQLGEMRHKSMFEVGQGRAEALGLACS
jgi:hypothetical protein